MPQEVIGIGEAVSTRVTHVNPTFNWSLIGLSLIFIGIFSIIIVWKVKKMKWKTVGKALLFGGVFTLISWLLSGDASSIVGGLFIIYLQLGFVPHLERILVELKQPPFMSNGGKKI